jgi:hypothetical protein
VVPTEINAYSTPTLIELMLRQATLEARMKVVQPAEQIDIVVTSSDRSGQVGCGFDPAMPTACCDA